jgi:hypothetical protein
LWLSVPPSFTITKIENRMKERRKIKPKIQFDSGFFRFRDQNSKSNSVLLPSFLSRVRLHFGSNRFHTVLFRIQSVPFGFISDPTGSVRFLFSTFRVHSVFYLKPTRTGFVASLIVTMRNTITAVVSNSIYFSSY